jgi:glucose/arabinose dehydrogenase
LLAILLAVVLTVAGCSAPETQVAEPTATATGPDEGDPGGDSRGGPKVIGTIATGLDTPWGVAFLPDDTALVSERDTTRIIAIKDGEPRVVGKIPQAAPGGEAGLLGLAVSPSFEDDRLVYAYLTTERDNRVIKFRFDGKRLGKSRNVLTGIPSAQNHDGGRLLFDDDGNLFVSTGEAGQPELSQDTDSLGGKILRITPDGTTTRWSMGHRNVQGLAFDDAGGLWATEFGANTWDELNRIEKGANYGWPDVEGNGEADGMVNPQVVWRTDEASPSGLAFLDGHLWAASLRGERLWRIPVDGDDAGPPEDFFVGDYGRMRTVVAAPDGNLWVTTSNHDGRGSPAQDDDRILVVDP